MTQNTNNTKEVVEIAQEAKQVAVSAKEVALEAADATKETLEHGTNGFLHFLGIPIDIATLTQTAIDISGRLILALAIFFIGKWIGNRVVNLIRNMMAKSKLDQTAANFLGNLLYGLMLVAVILAALNKLGVNTNSFVAILGAAGIAIGVSLKDQLSNLAAGVLIVIFRPFGRGDLVEVGGKIGTVLDITLVNTRIRSPNNHEIIIPNGDIMTTSSTNFSSLPTRRVDVLVGISYDADIRQAKDIMLKVASSNPLILKDPAPLVVVSALAESSVDLTMQIWTQNSDWFAAHSQMLEEIKYAFDEANIGIPFPNRTIQIEGLDDFGKMLCQTKNKPQE